MPSSKVKRKSKGISPKREKIPFSVKVTVLTEAGYKCGVPICRGILALDIHHMVEVSAGGGNVPENLLALCPTCHALYHRGEIVRESIYVWKSVLVSLTRAFDIFAVDQLLFLSKPESANLFVSGDGVLTFARLIAGGLATFALHMENGPLLLYSVTLTTTGQQLATAWISGKREDVRIALSRPRGTGN